jgi:hypothetical protein
MSNSVRPTSRREFMNKLVEPYSKEYGNPNEVFSENAKAGTPEINRAREVSQKNDTDTNFHIGIKDIDEAIMYYFKEVLKLSVIQNNTRIPIPVIYGTPENWKSVQNDGYYRDGYSKLMAPLLMFKRKSIAQNRNLGNKIDGNVVRNVQLFEKGYSRRNVYTRLDAFQPRAEEKEYVVSITPDYVTIEYECLVWTHFVEQMDSVLEAINFASRTYWGDKNKFQFYSDIQSFEDNLTYELGEERAVRSSFNITLNGYLIPNSINKEMAVSNRTFGISKVVFGMELAGTEAEVVSARNKPKSKQAASVVSADSTNITVINQSGGTFDPVIVAYLNTNKEQQGTYISSNKVSFGQWLAAPSTLPATSIDNFIFSCNGQLIEKSAITSFSEVSGGSELTVNIPLLGYSFESDDVIIAIGKFA